MSKTSITDVARSRQRRQDAGATRQALERVDLVELISRDGVSLHRDSQHRYRGLCPFHDEDTASLVVWPDGRGWYCFGCQRGGSAADYVMERTGCDFSRALVTLGIAEGRPVELPPLPPRAAGPAKPVEHPGELTDTYTYTDEDGHLAYQVLRYKAPSGKKTFRQRRPDGHGGWIWNLDGVARKLYRLRDVMTAPWELPVFIVEGEKDADRLWAEGCCATTSSGGAGHWPADESYYLTGRDVVILPDNDEAGRQHAQDVATHLGPLAASVRIVRLPNLPPKGDVSDWLDGGATVDDLAALLRGDGPPVAEVAPPEPEPEQPLALTELGNAERLVRAYGAVLRRTLAWGWTVYEGGRWKRDDTGAVMRMAKQTVRQMYTDSWALREEQGAALRKHALRSESAAALAAMLKLAESEEGVAVPMEVFDRQPWLLNCPNGTLDLTTGLLRPPDKADLISKRAGVPYDPTAACPTWLAFLDRIFAGQAELIAFVQRAVGYSLTGSIREQVLFLLYGTGANGKSTLLTTLQAVLGEYAQATPASTLLVRPDGAATNDLARLAGARLVAAVESEEGKRLAEALVKQMTGGDKLVARYLHQEYFEFVPVFKLWFSTNHKPVIRDTTDSIWRRVHLIPFTVTIPAGERDATLTERLIAEGPGILAWAVQGCAEWQRRGLDPPDAVVAATTGYRKDMDLLASFLNECCRRGPATLTTTHKALYKAYCEWTEESGERPISSRALSQRLAERGLISERGTGNVLEWYGIGLRGELGKLSK